MGGFTSLATTAMQALSIASTVAGTIDSFRDDSGQRAYERAQAQQRITMQGLQQETELKKAQNQQQLEASEQERLRRLRAEVARQRAAYGASGTGSSGGSAQAYLLGMTENSEEEGRQSSAAAAIRNAILERDYATKNLLSTLDVTQARERRNLNQVSALYNGLNNLTSVL